MPSNALIRDFTSRLQSKFDDDRANMTMSDWLMKNTRYKKRPFSFEGFEFQRQIVDDMHPDLACIKCSQIGLSEIQVRKNFAFLKRNAGVSTIFTLPNEKMFKRISATRAGPIVNADAVFNMDMATKPIRSMALYQIDQSFGYFTGMTEGDATSISADALWHDEVDLSDQQMLGLFQSRLQGSRYKITQGFSTPTYEGFGIDAAYKVSDKHEYLARCPRCRHYNAPTFAPQFVKLPGLSSDINRLDEIDDEMAARIDFANAMVVCERCGGELPYKDPATREWVAERPGAMKRGYRVRPFCVPHIEIEYIVRQLLKQKAANRLRSWYNTVLGEPFNDSNARLSEADVRAVMLGLNEIEVGPEEPVAIGIDVGQTCHVVLVALGRPEPIVFRWLQIQAEKLPAAIADLREQYNIVVGGMDRHPYEPTANQVRDESQSRIFPIEYRGSDVIRIVEDEFGQFSHVQANRTKAIDTAVALIRKQRVRFAGYGHLERVIIQHCMDMIRIEDPGDSSTLDKPNEWNKPAVWNKTTGEDHFMHALVFAFAAMKAKDVQDHSGDEDVRIMSGGIIVTAKTHNDERLGLRRMSQSSTSLGTAQG